MADARDLKSRARLGRAGSIPASATFEEVSFVSATKPLRVSWRRIIFVKVTHTENAKGAEIASY